MIQNTAIPYSLTYKLHAKIVVLRLLLLIFLTGMLLINNLIVARLSEDLNRIWGEYLL